MKPSGHSAVMSQRAATAPDELDYFPTPPWAARAGGELIQQLDPGCWSGWEPACGEGHMAHGMFDYFREGVLCTDVFPYGAGPVCDFLSAEADEWGDVDHIFSNPPFKAAEAFIRAAWPRARRGVSMLLRSVFREGAGRYGLFRDIPLTASAQFCERVPMVKGRWDPDASSATAYSWFVFLKPEVDTPAQQLASAARALMGPGAGLDLLIPPGTKARLSRRGDIARFCAPAAAPLFGGG